MKTLPSGDAPDVAYPCIHHGRLRTCDQIFKVSLPTQTQVPAQARHRRRVTGGQRRRRVRPDRVQLVVPAHDEARIDWVLFHTQPKPEEELPGHLGGEPSRDRRYDLFQKNTDVRVFCPPCVAPQSIRVRLGVRFRFQTILVLKWRPHSRSRRYQGRGDEAHDWRTWTGGSTRNWRRGSRRSTCSSSTSHFPLPARFVFEFRTTRKRIRSIVFVSHGTDPTTNPHRVRCEHRHGAALLSQHARPVRRGAPRTPRSAKRVVRVTPRPPARPRKRALAPHHDATQEIVPRKHQPP